MSTSTVQTKETIYEKANVLEEYGYATLYQVPEYKEALIIQAKGEYIPVDDFKKTFISIGEHVKKHHIKKLVFDKRRLKVFHQPSMEWYFSIWKEEMFGIGLTQHRKLLPTDQLFRNSVQIGRNKINRDYPDAKFHEMSITYHEDLEEALSL